MGLDRLVRMRYIRTLALLVVASGTAVAMACGEIDDEGGSSSCVALASCCANLPVNQSPSECVTVAQGGTAAACTESLVLYASDGFCGADGGRGQVTITVPTVPNPGELPSGDTFPGGIVIGGSCNGDVYVEGTIEGYAFCDDGVWTYTDTDPAEDGYTLDTDEGSSSDSFDSSYSFDSSDSSDTGSSDSSDTGSSDSTDSSDSSSSSA
jgi:hypothetical protein